MNRENEPKRERGRTLYYGCALELGQLKKKGEKSKFSDGRSLYLGKKSPFSEVAQSAVSGEKTG